MAAEGFYPIGHIAKSHPEWIGAAGTVVAYPYDDGRTVVGIGQHPAGDGDLDVIGTGSHDAANHLGSGRQLRFSGGPMGAFDEPAWDIYREIHKAARLVLCRAILVAGSADAESDESMDDVRRAVDDVLFVLRGHHGHERDFVDELVALHAAELRDEVEAAHVASADALDRIERLTARVIAEPAASRNPLLHRLYLDLSAFASDYFAHLDVEERRVMPALNEAMSRTELIQLTEDLRSSVEPTEMCRYMQSMLPSMNVLERTDMLTGMSHAPPAIWDQFRAAARQALSAGEYDAATQQVPAS